MASPSGFSPQMLQGAESSFQMVLLGADTEKQQSKRTTKSSKSVKQLQAKLATISLGEYVHLFHLLTNGQGNVVQPNCDIKLFTCAQLRAVSRLHGLKTYFTKNELLLSLVGMELWNPFMLGPLEARSITDEEMMEDLHVLQW